MYWVYKCNSKDREYQRTYGDWAEVFEGQGPQWWGTTEIVPELSNAKVGDTILAYQTDRNELVGVAHVVGWKPQGKFRRLILKPIRTIGVRVRPLKKTNPKVARIPALQPGQIRTLYSISRADAAALLKSAGVHMALAAEVSENAAQQAAKGGGFGTPENNKRVEKAAVRHVMRHYKSQGWSVKDVSSENRGYDLVRKGRCPDSSGNSGSSPASLRHHHLLALRDTLLQRSAQCGQRAIATQASQPRFEF